MDDGDWGELDNTRQFRRGEDVTVIGLDDCAVLRRENGGDWEDEACDWDGEAEETFEAWCDALLEDGWVEEPVTGLPSLSQRLDEAWGPLPAAYRAFLESGRHAALAECVITGVPTFADDHALWVDLASPKIAGMDFGGVDPERRYVPISRELFDADDREGDPHPLFFAVDRTDPRAPVALVSHGGVSPAYATLEVFLASVESSG